MNRAKRQHTIPRMHLQHFVDVDSEGMVWTYDLDQDRVWPSLPSETGIQSNFYSVKIEDGAYFDGYDKWLQEVEDRAPRPYEMLLCGEIPTDQDKADFSVFIATLFLRSPAQVFAHADLSAKLALLLTDFHLSDRRRFDRMVDNLERERGEKIDREQLLEFMQDKDRYWLEVDQDRGLDALSLADKIAPIFFDRNWCVLDAEADFFITSDNPVVKHVDRETQRSPRSDGGFKNPNARFSVPLSATKMLWICGVSDTDQSASIDHRIVWQLNNARAYYAERFLYGSKNDDRVSEIARKYKDRKPRITVSAGTDFPEIKIKR